MLARQLDISLGATAALVLLASCTITAGPDAPPHLEFSEPVLDLGTLRQGQVEVRNTGGQSVGPVELLVSGIRDASGATVPGSHLLTDPQEIATLNAGSVRVVHVSLSVEGSLIPGNYDAAITARGEQESSAQMAVRFVVLDAPNSAVVSVELLSTQTTARVPGGFGLVEPGAGRRRILGRERSVRLLRGGGCLTRRPRRRRLGYASTRRD